MTVKNSGRDGCSGCEARTIPFFDPEGPAIRLETQPAMVRHDSARPSSQSRRQVPKPGQLCLVTVGSREIHQFGIRFFSL